MDPNTFFSVTALVIFVLFFWSCLYMFQMCCSTDQEYEHVNQEHAVTVKEEGQEILREIITSRR